MASFKVVMYNCDRTVDLSAQVTPLFDGCSSEYTFDQSMVYFGIRDIESKASELERQEPTDHIAVFAVNANESRLSINEERAGIGYRKIYQAIRNHSKNHVLVLIVSDSDGMYTSNGPLITARLKSQVSAQFTDSQFHGQESFILSWDQTPTEAHIKALEYYCRKFPDVGEPYSPPPTPFHLKHNSDHNNTSNKVPWNSPTDIPRYKWWGIATVNDGDITWEEESPPSEISIKKLEDDILASKHEKVLVAYQRGDDCIILKFTEPNKCCVS